MSSPLSATSPCSTELVREYFCAGDYLKVVSNAFSLKATPALFHYYCRACVELDAVPQLIAYMIRQPPFARSSAFSNGSRLASMPIPDLSDLLKKQGLTSADLGSRRYVLEGYLKRNYFLIDRCQLLGDTQRTRLSNLVNFLGDVYTLQGQPCFALDALELANLIFPGSFYSRVNYANLAYANGRLDLCVVQLRHANHLLYHSGLPDGCCYDPFSNSVTIANVLVVSNFFSLSWRTGFFPG